MSDVIKHQTICSLCGYRFIKTAYHCAHCPVNRNCRVICCPHCGFQMVDEAELREKLKKIGRFCKWLKKKILKKKS